MKNQLNLLIHILQAIMLVSGVVLSNVTYADAAVAKIAVTAGYTLMIISAVWFAKTRRN